MENVMIVSNDNISNAICRAHLEHLYTCMEVNSGVHALGCLKFHPTDMIIMDLDMAGMDGLEVLKALKKDDQTRDIPVIITVNEHHYDMDAIQHLYEEGAADVLTKPVTKIQLLRRMEYQFELRHLREENQRLKALLEQNPPVVQS